jgi:hypothetical protein
MRNYSRKFRRNKGGGLFGSSDPKQEVIDAQTKVDAVKVELQEAEDKLTQAQTKAASAPVTEPSTADKAKNALSDGADKVKDSLSGITSMFSSKPAEVPQTGAGKRRRSRKNRRSNKRR